MKRLSLVLLAFVFAMSCSSAIAESGNQPILFRDLPWGITYAEVNAQYELSGLFKDQNTPGYEKVYTSHTTFSDSAIGAIGTIAGGYRIEKVRLQFVQLPVSAEEDATADQYESNTVFYAASYQLTPPLGRTMTNEQVQDDLIAKLSGLYGEPDTTGEYPVWSDDSGASVTLEVFNQVFYIEYTSKTVGDDALQVAVEADQDDTFATDNSGL